MSELIVISFDTPHKADEVLNKLNRMEKEHLVDLEDAAVVIRRKDGKLKLKQSHNIVASGAVGGGFWGALIGTLFLNPLAGVLVGSATGAVAGALTDIGINDDFIKDLGNNLQPGTSALFVLVRNATPDKVLSELRDVHGKVLQTSLSYDEEEKLRNALEQK